MKRILAFAALTVLVLSASSCAKSRAEKMALAENVKVTCNPEVLQLVGDNIPAEITVTYPEDYFYPNAIVSVTPVLVYEGGSQVGPTFTYQGENVKDNYTVISHDNGGKVSQKVNFKYDKGVEKSYLELRGKCTYGKTTIEIAPFKVAEGVNTTAQLVDLGGTFAVAEDGYQYVLHKSTEGEIHYDVNSAVVKKSELRNQSIKELQAALEAIENDARTNVTGTQIIAYASPEGGQKLNAELSDKRAGTAEKAWNKLNDKKADDVQVKSIGQDWEGFQTAVSESNIKDKELILRVLNMYSDPAVRESEIRNMSQV